jgi:aminoglycoside 6'-N-acetyltransferase I
VDILDLAGRPARDHAVAAAMLVHEFAEPLGWRDVEVAAEEVARLLVEGFARGAFDGDELLGWVGGQPEYDGMVWELHPLVVRRADRGRGVGRALVAAFEEEARRRGGLTATLGTDDNTGMTTLADVDLYDDVPGHIAALRDLGRGHPFAFYERLGWVVTGVVPDANGPGRPDIIMSKRLASERLAR